MGQVALEQATRLRQSDPDTDDRVLCACKSDMHGLRFDSRCLNRTRDVSGFCSDCRPDELAGWAPGEIVEAYGS